MAIYTLQGKDGGLSFLHGYLLGLVAFERDGKDPAHGAKFRRRRAHCAPLQHDEQDRTKLAVVLSNSHTEVYHSTIMDISPYHRSLDCFCAALGAGGKDVLELACVPGNMTKYVMDLRPELRISATDLAPKMLEMAQANNPGVNFQLLDCRAMTSLGRTIDGIIGGFCLPYLDPEETQNLIRDAARILRKNGVLYLSTMEDDPAKSGWRASSSSPNEQVYMRYYEVDFLTNALLAHGFTVLDLSRTQTSAADGTLFNDLMIVAGRFDKDLQP